MRCFKKLSRGLLALTIFSLAFQTPGNATESSSQMPIVVPGEDPWEALQNGHLVSYDSVIDILKRIEADDFEETCSQEELDKIIPLVILLTRLGVLPGETDEEALERDIQELLDPSESYEYSYPVYYGDDYEITPLGSKF
jgi:hypothetical protein